MIEGKIIELVFNDGTRHEVVDKITVIGRGNKCNVRVNDPKVSRIHCQITVLVEETTITITDGDIISSKPSSYGTYVNGNRLAPNEAETLQNNTLISLGTGASFRVFITDKLGRSDELNPKTAT